MNYCKKKYLIEIQQNKIQFLKKEMEKKRKDDIEREAEIRAKEKEYVLKLKKAAEEKAKRDAKSKPKFSKNSYFFSFKYQIEEHAGNKIFQFTDFDGKKNKEYEIINKKDKVIYLNDDHPNHMKKGVVTKINIIEGSTDSINQ